ncbi:putative chitinase 1 [Ixodes scapularis]|uniref:putative chitinase 1 n=1 Tax=Ixodes scapularis TaxID=6945 RepID=UPI001AD6AD00|nr:putative chitinase 1 [Ixodes scapularis]
MQLYVKSIPEGPGLYRAEQLQYLSVVRHGWPHLSVLTTLGGDERDDNALTRALEGGDPALQALAKEVAAAVRLNDFDGVNLHWAEPDLDGDVERDEKGFSTLVKLLRQELGPKAIIAVMLPNDRETRRAVFDMRSLLTNANFLFVNTHEVLSPYSALTRFAGPAREAETGGMFKTITEVLHELNTNSTRNLCFTVGLAGVAYPVNPEAKLDVYLPLKSSEVAAAAGGAQVAGRATAEASKEGRPVSYEEVCKLNLTCHLASAEKSCYDKRRDSWYGFVDEQTIASKVTWLLKNGWEHLCVVAWNVDADDTSGSCRSTAGPYPLLRSVSGALMQMAY